MHNSNVRVAMVLRGDSDVGIFSYRINVSSFLIRKLEHEDRLIIYSRKWFLYPCVIYCVYLLSGSRVTFIRIFPKALY
jgi:hypothetical protein